MRDAKCMREVHKQHYACALKVASEQRATDFTVNQVFPGLWRKWFLKLQNNTRERLHQNTPPPFAEPALGAQDHSLINRRMAVEGKERPAPVAN